MTMFEEKKAKSGSRGTIFKAVGVLFGLVLILGYQRFFRPQNFQKSSIPSGSGVVAILDAVKDKKSGAIVQGFAAVKTILPDDVEGGKHQKFIAALETGQTILFAHNIDIAPRVPLKLADLFEFRGEYQWNEQGGVVHWTHHDPDMKHVDGWIKIGDKAFR